MNPTSKQRCRCLCLGRKLEASRWFIIPYRSINTCLMSLMGISPAGNLLIIASQVSATKLSSRKGQYSITQLGIQITCTTVIIPLVLMLCPRWKFQNKPAYGSISIFYNNATACNCLPALVAFEEHSRILKQINFCLATLIGERRINGCKISLCEARSHPRSTNPNKINNYATTHG